MLGNTHSVYTLLSSANSVPFGCDESELPQLYSPAPGFALTSGFVLPLTPSALAVGVNVLTNEAPVLTAVCAALYLNYFSS